MGRSKSDVLKKGNVQYHSTMFDLYFVTERQNYTYKGKACNRLIYFILGKGKHRKKDHRLRKVCKAEYDKKLKDTKQYEAYMKQKHENDRLRKIKEEQFYEDRRLARIAEEERLDKLEDAN